MSSCPVLKRIALLQDDGRVAKITDSVIESFRWLADTQTVDHVTGNGPDDK